MFHRLCFIIHTPWYDARPVPVPRTPVRVHIAIRVYEYVCVYVRRGFFFLVCCCFVLRQYGRCVQAFYYLV